MSTPLTDTIENLTSYINEVTGGDDTNLSDAVATLAEGHGGVSVDGMATRTMPVGKVIISSDTIGDYAFTKCSNITYVQFTNPQLLKINNNAFLSCVNLKTVTGEYVTEMGDSVFNSCGLLTDVILPNLNKIGENCFHHCASLVDVSLPKVEILQFQTFRSCSSLKKVKLASCTTFKGRYHFTACSRLEDIYLPNDESTYTGAPWGAPTTCTIHYNTQFDENGEPILE